MTGLSGAGKSTISRMVTNHIEHSRHKRVTLLDGDHARARLSPDLGYSTEDRHHHLQRIGYVAAEVARHGGISICACIAPYAESRQQVRTMVEEFGEFVLVYVSTPLEVCEARDSKGLYAKARQGLITGFTGISDPYEPPANPDIIINTAQESADNATITIVSYLEYRGCINPTSKSLLFLGA
jgi:sulfate adenylyltransferase